ncbi:MAG: anti-sigma factor family protein [Gemmatimonadota bacterium]
MSCAAPLPPTTLIEYWLGELDPSHEQDVERHLLGCASCSDELQHWAELGDGLRALARGGVVASVVSSEFVARIAARGLRVREYRVPCNGSVHCTVAPDDEVMIARLAAPLARVARLDLLMSDEGDAAPTRLSDIPFRADAGEVVLAPPIEHVRALPASTSRMQLVAVDGDRERVVGDYTFIHRPWAARPT